MSNTMERTDLLAAAMRRAQSEANALSVTEDGGTCNFDSCVLGVSQPGVDSRVVEAAAKEAGVTAYPGTWFGKKVYFVGETSGQGNRRSRMAEAFCRVMKAEGFNASMYYQMD